MVLDLGSNIGCMSLHIAEKAGYCYSIHGAHVEGMMLSYGTAILSKYPLCKPACVDFVEFHSRFKILPANVEQIQNLLFWRFFFLL